VEFLSDDVAADLLGSAVLQDALEAGVAFADFYCTSEKLAKPLEASGFVREDLIPQPLPNLFRPLEFERERLNGALWVKPGCSIDQDGLWTSDELYLTRSDCDQDRPN
jgi:hypothetical protein